jgi:hypothetical protein
MAKTVLRRVSVPGSYFKVSREKKHTRYVAPFGIMQGRRVVPKAQSDKTGVVRIVKPYDVNRDGDTKDKVDLQKGQIIGRTSGSAKPQRVQILRHWSGGKVVRTHSRRYKK